MNIDGEPIQPGFDYFRNPKADAPPQNIKINPERRQHYQMEIRIHDAPIDFKFIRASELYQATNCWYATNRSAGASANPQFSLPLNLKKINDTTYVTDFYTDSPLNEDYYGQGVCKWEFLDAGLVMLATGEDDTLEHRLETKLDAVVELSDLEKLSETNPEIKIKRYYAKEDYPIWHFFTQHKGDPLNAGSSGLNDSGNREENVSLDKTSGKLFTVELIIRSIKK